MYKKILNGQRSGTVFAPASKSQMHRYLICAALGKTPVKIECNNLSIDVKTTANALKKICADIDISGDIITVTPKEKPNGITVNCRESGSTLRFLLPVCAALGKTVCFKMGKSLKTRPVEPLLALLKEHGVSVRVHQNKINISGKLKSGNYKISGDISSQFVSGMLFAISVLGESTLEIIGDIKSKPYIELTENALKMSGICFEKQGNIYSFYDRQNYSLPQIIKPEGDYSAAAVFLCMGALSQKGITVKNLKPDSLQGDKKIIDILTSFGADVSVSENSVTVKKNKLSAVSLDASDIPDLVPAIAVLSCLADGESRISGIERLKYKETDRLKTTAMLVSSLGGNIDIKSDEIIISGNPAFSGGKVDSFSDHRIAMAAAIAACGAKECIKLKNYRCTDKSFIGFWEDFSSLEV